MHTIKKCIIKKAEIFTKTRSILTVLHDSTETFPVSRETFSK